MAMHTCHGLLLMLGGFGIIFCGDASDVDRQPFGVLMCRQLCQRISGCTSPNFYSFPLKCHVSLPQGCATSTNKRETTNYKEIGIKFCSKCSRFVQTRNKQIQCVKDQATKEIIKRLLGVAKRRGESKFYQYDIESHITRTYDFISANHVYDLAYDLKLKKLWVARTPFGVDVYKMDSRKKVFTKNITALALTVDVDADIVFYVGSESTRGYVGMVSTSGKILKKINNAIDLPNDVTVDSKHRTVYVGLVSGLISFQYDGGSTRTLVEGLNITALTFDVFENVIYFAVGYTLRKVSLSTQSEEVTSFRQYIASLTYDDQNIYISYHEGPTISIFDVNTRRVMDIMSVGWHKMCLIR